MKITPSKFAKALADILEKAPNPKEAIKNFFAVLQRKKAMKLLQKILTSFEKEWADRRNIKRLFIRTPKKFEKDTENFIQEFEKKSGTKIEAKIIADDSLIGGMVIHTDDTLIDASMKHQLKQLKSSLKSRI